MTVPVAVSRRVISIAVTVPESPAVSWIDSVARTSRSVLPAPHPVHSAPVTCDGLAVTVIAAEDGPVGGPPDPHPASVPRIANARTSPRILIVVSLLEYG